MRDYHYDKYNVIEDAEINVDGLEIWCNIIWTETEGDEWRGQKVANVDNVEVTKIEGRRVRKGFENAETYFRDHNFGRIVEAAQDFLDGYLDATAGDY